MSLFSDLSHDLSTDPPWWVRSIKQTRTGFLVTAIDDDADADGMEVSYWDLQGALLAIAGSSEYAEATRSACAASVAHQGLDADVDAEVLSEVLQVALFGGSVYA